MSQLVILFIVGAAVLLALLMAYVPMRILLTQMAKKVAAPIRDFIQRQRERRANARESPDRRKPGEPAPPPKIIRQTDDRRQRPTQ